MKSARKMRSCSILAALLNLLLINHCLAQDSISSKRLKPLLITSAVAYTGTMAALGHLWYKDHEKTSFHFFNDNSEWKQMDKAGHFFAAYHLSAISYQGLQWGSNPSGMNDRKAALWGAAAGFAMLMPVEWLDGYSKKYGASVGDMIANATGSLFFLSQHLLWSESRIIPKFSFHRTPYAAKRPAVLGNGLYEEWLKDYNGQTYWLSFDTDKFFPSEKRWISFLNIAAGYGAHGMVYARDEENLAAGYKNYRQYYLALDLDLTAIKTRSKVLKAVIFLLNTIRLPAPAISYGNDKLNFYLFYF